MSRHEIVEDPYTLIFGWDQPLQSFFLQVHSKDTDEEHNPIHWLGADQSTQMYEVEDLVRALHKYGAHKLDHAMQVTLYHEKDAGV